MERARGLGSRASPSVKGGFGQTLVKILKDSKKAKGGAEEVRWELREMAA